MADTDPLANSIFAALTSDLDLITPSIDLDLADFEIPTDSGAEAYGTINRLTEADLTTRTVGGEGMFDGLMMSLKAHLKEEHKEGRMSGKEYSDAYVAMTQSAMGLAAQYLINRDSQYWSNLLVQSQAQVAQVEVVKARLSAAVAREELKIAATSTKLRAAEYARVKQQLATGEAEYDLAVKQFEKSSYELTTLLPKQAALLDGQDSLLTAQEIQVGAQTAQVTYETSDVLPAQVAKTTADTTVSTNQASRIAAEKLVVDNEAEIGDYRILNMLPRELAQLNSQVSATEAQTANFVAQKEVIDNEAAIGDFRITSLLPIELAKLTAEKDIVLSEELRIDAQTLQISTETTTLLPKQVEKLTADVVISTNEAERITAQTALITSDKLKTDNEVAIGDYRILNMLPQELAKLTGEVTIVTNEATRIAAQTDAIGSEKIKTDLEVSSVLPAQVASITADTAIKTYEVGTLLPKQVDKLDEDILLSSAQISQVTAQKDSVLAETASLLPARVANIGADTDTKDYQHLTLMPAQKEKLVAEQLLIMYDKETLKPAQLKSIEWQTEGHRAKVKELGGDGLAIEGSIGKQKALHEEQILSYRRDVEAKVAKLYLDTYITAKTVDPNLAVPGQLDKEKIDTIMGWLRGNAGMPHPVV